MGSEKPTQDDLDLIARFCQGYSFHFDNDRARIRRLLEAYKETQRPIEPDEQRAGGVTREDREAWIRAQYGRPLRDAFGERKTVDEHARDSWAETGAPNGFIGVADENGARVIAQHRIASTATLRTQLAAAERERDAARMTLQEVVRVTKSGMDEVLENSRVYGAKILAAHNAEMAAATARAETAEGLLRAIVRENDGTPDGCVAWGMASAITAARAHLQSLKGGSDAEG